MDNYNQFQAEDNPIEVLETIKDIGYFFAPGSTMVEEQKIGKLDYELQQLQTPEDQPKESRIFSIVNRAIYGLAWEGTSLYLTITGIIGTFDSQQNNGDAMKMILAGLMVKYAANIFTSLTIKQGEKRKATLENRLMFKGEL